MRDLGHVTTAISEAANALIKHGKVSVNDAMPLDQTLKTINSIELQNLRNVALDANMRVTSSWALEHAFKDNVVVALGSGKNSLTQFCIDRFVHPAFEQHKRLKVSRIATDVWIAKLPVREDQKVPLDRDGLPLIEPWPKFEVVHEVRLNSDRTLSCSCMHFESCLCPCAGIIAVKQGRVDHRDFHFRWLTRWQSGHIPLQAFPRSFGDGAKGPTCNGVDFSACVCGDDIDEFDLAAVEDSNECGWIYRSNK